MRNKYFPFYLISFSVIILLVVPVLIQDGMFMDGQQYAIIANNLAHGKGTFWFPFLTESWFKAGSQYFVEHPPLVYGIQAIFFKILGTSMYVERFYSFLTSIITAFLIIKLWKVTVEKEYKNLAFIPVLLWIITPIVFWSYRNNVQENTLGIFALLSVINAILFIKNKKYINLVFSGVFIFLASLCKGVPGLFPLVAFFMYYLSGQRKIKLKNVILYSVVLLLVVVFIYSIILINKTANKSLNFYFFNRLLYRINDEPTVGSRFYILYRLLSELLPMIGVTLLFIIISKIKKIKNSITKKDLEHVIFFILIGLSASLPLMLTKVQRGFYLLPAFPYFAIAFALLLKNYYYQIINKIIEKSIVKYFAITLFVFSLFLSATKIGKISRDRDLLSDIYKIGEIVPENTVISTNEETYNNWYLQFYLYRKYNISVKISNDKNLKFKLLTKTVKCYGKKYKKLKIRLLNYDLCKLKE